MQKIVIVKVLVSNSQSWLLSIVAGFLTWQGEERFTFEKWEGKFIATEVSLITTGIRLN